MSKPEDPIKTHNAVLHYLHTHVRRLLGVNISQIEPLLFVGGSSVPTSGRLSINAGCGRF